MANARFGNQLAVAVPGADTVFVYERRTIFGDDSVQVQWAHGFLTPNGAASPVGIAYQGFGSILSLDQGTLIVGVGPSLALPGVLKVLARFQHQGDSGGDPAFNWKRASR